MSKFKNSVEVVPAVESPVPTVAFNVWFAMREKRIPARHLREIIWADFKGQGLSLNETVATFDAALASYGVKL
jgi:hypothetical protein